MQFKVTGGPRRVRPAATPDAARRSRSTRRTPRSPIDRPGYYRVDVDERHARRSALVAAGRHRRPADGERPRRRRRTSSSCSRAPTRRPARRSAAAGARRLGSLELRAHGQLIGESPRSAQYVSPGRSRRRRPRPATATGAKSRLRPRLGAAQRRRRTGRRTARAAGSRTRTTAGRGSTTRRGAGRRITTAAGSTSAAPGAGRRARSSSRRSTRRRSSRSSAARRRRLGERRRAVRELVRARLGRARHSVVGPRRLRRPAVLGRLGRPARREQCRDQQHDDRQRAHQPLREHERSTTRSWASTAVASARRVGPSVSTDRRRVTCGRCAASSA